MCVCVHDDDDLGMRDRQIPNTRYNDVSALDSVECADKITFDTIYNVVVLSTYRVNILQTWISSAQALSKTNSTFLSVIILVQWNRVTAQGKQHIVNNSVQGIVNFFYYSIIGIMTDLHLCMVLAILWFRVFSDQMFTTFTPN